MSVVSRYEKKIKAGWVPSSPLEELPKPTEVLLTPEQIEERRRSGSKHIEEIKTRFFKKPKGDLKLT